MKSVVTFMKSKNGRASFAKLGIETKESKQFKIEWSDQCAEYKSEYSGIGVIVISGGWLRKAEVYPVD